MRDWIKVAACAECSCLVHVINGRLETHLYRRLRCNGSGQKDYYEELARAEPWTQRNEPPEVAP